MKKHLQNLRNEQGLTLVELLAVVVILAIIAVIAFVMIGQVIDNAKKDTHIANAHQMIESAKLYQLTEGDIGASGITLGDLQDSGHIEKPLREPWKNTPIDADKGKVTYTEADGYKVSLDGVTGTGGDAKGCKIENVEEEKFLEEGKQKRTVCN